MLNDHDIKTMMDAMGAKAQAAARAMARATTGQKNVALRSAADLIEARRSSILQTNAREYDAAKAAGTTEAFLDRMALTSSRIDGMAAALREIADFDDPVGNSIRNWTRPNGLQIERVRTPIGVVAVIYESRPNVTADAAAICLKAGNAAILRGGSECIATSKMLFDCLAEAIRQSGLPEHAAQFVDTTDRAAVGEILSGLNGRIDLVIPRGGKSLVARVQAEARAPVLSHLEGLCHVYVDRDASIPMAVDIVVNSKMRRPGVCGAAETLLIDRAILPSALKPIVDALRSANCILRGDDAVLAVDPSIEPATQDDWSTEYLAPILSIAAVEGVQGALDHIARFGSGHTEAVVTDNAQTASWFIAGCDSAIVLHNASTQFADGGEFGLGAEIGIATGRLHARGPVGVEELTSYKNVVRGAGQTRPG